MDHDAISAHIPVPEPELAPMPDNRPVPAMVDYVVVGAGAAGCVVAARLSARQNSSVLLLEGGGVIDPALAQVPGRFWELESAPSVYEDMTPPQPGLGGRRLAMHTGRGLGGGSSVNVMGWFQGMPVDYDGWRDGGAAGWGWDDMRPYLRRSEDHELGASEWHGAAGPMSITAPRHLHPITTAFVAAAAQHGLQVSSDLNGAMREGVGLAPSNIRDGRRWSVVEGYLRPASGRDNLQIRHNTAVSSLLTDNGRVVGVRTAGPAGVEVLARRAVILCAGALRTPHLMLLAGIGPARHLQDHGIGLLADLPGVGSNLHDHPLVPTMWPLLDATALRDASYDDASRTYDLLRRGPLSAAGQAVAVIRSAATLHAPDIQLPIALLGTDAGVTALERDTLGCMVALLTPRSRGTVRLASNDPAHAPVVDPRYLDDPADLEPLRAGIRRLLSIFSMPALANVTGPVMGLSAEPTDEELDSYIAGQTTPYWHLVGTARLGTDRYAVSHPASMAVHSVPGLYVADASAIPTITRGNTHAPTIALAERASDLILHSTS